MNLVSSIEALSFLIAQASTAVPAAAPTGAEGGAPSPTGGLMQMMPLMVGVILVMYFLTIRPQQKRDKERQNMLNALKKGDEVVTTGGICGKVQAISDADVVLKVDDNVTIKFVRTAIAYVAKVDGDGGK